MSPQSLIPSFLPSSFPLYLVLTFPIYVVRGEDESIFFPVSRRLVWFSFSGELLSPFRALSLRSDKILQFFIRILLVIARIWFLLAHFRYNMLIFCHILRENNANFSLVSCLFISPDNHDFWRHAIHLRNYTGGKKWFAVGMGTWNYPLPKWRVSRRS